MHHSVRQIDLFNFLFVSGTEDIVAPHGIPVDLLDRLLIIRTLPYTKEEVKTVLGIRAKVESVQLNEEALDRIADMGVRTSLRYL